MTTFYTTFESPVGPLLLMSDGQSLTGLHTDSDKQRPVMRPDWIRDEAAVPFAEVIAQLRGYFEGRVTEFDLPLAPNGSEFQLRVWRELRGIPYGETISYAELARRIGRPQASRAVGHANARNPVSIIVPCHRVIGADNSLTGYAGGLERKRMLLAHEAKHRGMRDEGREARGKSNKGQLSLAGM
ncbi:MAG TPA: methylated-DNA--[protein]-cysteine S-methyltransferase [Burkholderiales bacterium]|nr:methylated-DNA--[protein]-cysteine S-methyltransferase [Burkholderiales bacterium]